MFEIIPPMEYAKFSSLELCLFSDEQYVTDWPFILADLQCSFTYIKEFPCHRFYKAMSYQTNSQTTEIKQAIQIILTFLCIQVVVSRSCCWPV